MDGFDVDGRKFRKVFGEVPTFNSLGATPGGSVYEFYARGGGVGTDTVPAMLTPGEFIFSKPAVDSIAKMFGGGFLPALNASRIDAGALDRLINLPAPTRPRGYASGGYVDDVRPAATATVSAGGNHYTININANPGDLLSQENVRRLIEPAIRTIERRSGKK